MNRDKIIWESRIDRLEKGKEEQMKRKRIRKK